MTASISTSFVKATGSVNGTTSRVWRPRRLDPLLQSVKRSSEVLTPLTENADAICSASQLNLYSPTSKAGQKLFETSTLMRYNVGSIWDNEWRSPGMVVPRRHKIWWRALLNPSCGKAFIAIHWWQSSKPPLQISVFLCPIASGAFGWCKPYKVLGISSYAEILR